MTISFLNFVLQKVLKMLNTKGVVYRPGKDNMSDNEEEVGKKEGIQVCDVVNSDDNDTWMDSDKTENKTKDGTNAENTTHVRPGASPHVPIVIDDNEKARKLPTTDSLIDLTLPEVHVISDSSVRDGSSEEFESFNTMCQKAKESGKKEGKKEDLCGKRKRKLPLKLRSPVVPKSAKRTKCPIRKGIFCQFFCCDLTIHVLIIIITYRSYIFVQLRR